MKKTTLIPLASAALALPAALPAMAQNTPASQSPQAQNSEQRQNQQAANQPIPSKQLGRRGVRQMQQALNKSGHHVAVPTALWGRGPARRCRAIKNRRACRRTARSTGRPWRISASRLLSATRASSLRTRKTITSYPAATRARAPTGNLVSTMGRSPVREGGTARMMRIPDASRHVKPECERLPGIAWLGAQRRINPLGQGC